MKKVNFRGAEKRYSFLPNEVSVLVEEKQVCMLFEDLSIEEFTKYIELAVIEEGVEVAANWNATNGWVQMWLPIKNIAYIYNHE